MSGLATKQQSLKLFEKLKSKQANKASHPYHPSSRCQQGAEFGRETTATPTHDDGNGLLTTDSFPRDRSASTAVKRTQHGPPFLLASTSASIARPTIATSVSTSPLFGLLTSTVCPRFAFACLRQQEPIITNLAIIQSGNGTSSAS